MYMNYMNKEFSNRLSCCNNQNEYNDEKMLEDCCLYIQNNLNNYNNECSCGFDEDSKVFPMSPMYAQSYVPIQTMNRTFKPCVGLKMGTIFPELVSPYMPGQSKAENEYLANMNEIGMGCNKC